MFKIKSMLTENSCHCPFKGLVTLDTALQWRCSWGEIGENELCLISREKSEKVDFAVEKHNLPGRELMGILWELSHTSFGQVFLLGLKLSRSEDWSAVCRRAHAQTGFKMASQTHTFNSSSPSHQWGNLPRMVTRCQSGRSIRNWFWTELETDWTIIFGLNRTETLHWTE